ncbi:UNC93-like protein MFSD11 [Brevipalpus obovatus]|uniref:UNC93-like protein MFSD11 n=1 Tax=Brevipalpus obovatus TaxID=246614 RepID=UPI003D9E8E6D
MAIKIDPGTLNVVLIGIGFLFLFSANNTAVSIEAMVVSSVNTEFGLDWEGNSWDAFSALSIYMLIFGIGNLIAPMMIEILGPKMSVLISGISIWASNLLFIIPFKSGLILNSLIGGFFGAIVWTGQGTILAVNSDASNITLNSSLFWIIYQLNRVIGNGFIMFEFDGVEVIETETRVKTFLLLMTCASFGLLSMSFIKDVKSKNEDAPVRKASPIQAMKSMATLAKSKEMMLISVMSFYLGIVIPYYSGIYGTAIGFTRELGTDRKKYSGEAGIIFGIGEIIGCCVLLGIPSKYSSQIYCKKIVMFIGYLFHMFSFVASYFNLPAHSSWGETDEAAIMHTSLGLALTVSFMLGVGDAFIQAQIWTLLSSYYKGQSSAAFAIFLLVECMSAAATFFYSNFVDMHGHSYILIITGTLGIIAILKAYSMMQQEKKEDEESNKKDVNFNLETYSSSVI